MPATAQATRPASRRRPSRPRQRDARRRLLDAALRRFDEEGTVGATLEQIRLDAGVSTGALYHHFPDKAALAAALYQELLADFQRGFLAALREQPDAEGGVKAGVRQYLRWVGENRAAARFLLGERPAGPSLRELNREFFAGVMEWWRTHVHYGSLRDLPFDLISALWLGPAHEYTRHRLAARTRRSPAAAGVLAEAAWQTLKEER